jgi:hypothetical protein
MSQTATTTATPQVTQREFKLDTTIKEKTVVEKIPVGKWMRFAFIPMWLFWRLLPFLFNSQQWTNRIWRMREVKYIVFAVLLLAGIFIIIWQVVPWQSEGGKVLKFFLAWIPSQLILNAYSERWLPKNFSKLMETDKMITIADAPDAIGISFPLGWTPERNFVFYGFRRAIDKPEIFPRHLAAFGIDGYGQTAFALNGIMNAFSQMQYKFLVKDLALSFFKIFLFRFEPPQRHIIHGLSPVVLIMNPSDAGIDFHDLAELRGIVVYTTQFDCEKAIWYTWQELRRRRDNGDKTSPRILIIADDAIANAFIGQNSTMKNLTPAIQDIVENGNRFNINLMIFPKPSLYEGRAKEIYRYRYDCAQFYTEVMREVKLKQGDSFERKVDSPPAYVGLFHWKVRGKIHTLKGVEPNRAQLAYRIQQSDYSSVAFKLCQKFSEFDFNEYPKYERVDETKKPQFEFGDEFFEQYEKWKREKFMRERGGKIAVGPSSDIPDLGAQEEFYQLHHAPKNGKPSPAIRLVNGNGANGHTDGKQLDLVEEET